MTVKELEQVTIIALKGGSIDAFNLCYDLYYKPLCSFANYIVKQPAIAEEITQTIFLDVWMNRDKLPENSSIKAYLLTAVKHDCLDFLKHKKIEEKYAGEYLLSSVEHYEDIFDDLINKDLQESLDRAINKLPKHCREIFLLSRFNFLPYKDIANKLNISVKTVENQISKALRIVRKELDPFL
jgi:RNA polymerase sigma-70 factor (ECF subfamily)